MSWDTGELNKAVAARKLDSPWTKTTGASGQYDQAGARTFLSEEASGRISASAYSGVAADRNVRAPA